MAAVGLKPGAPDSPGNVVKSTDLQPDHLKMSPGSSTKLCDLEHVTPSLSLSNLLPSCEPGMNSYLIGYFTNSVKDTGKPVGAWHVPSTQ